MSPSGTWEGKLKPRGGLGRLEDLVNFFVDKGYFHCHRFDRYRVVVMAADNGVSQEGISLYPPMSSARIVEAHLSGAAPPVIFLQRIGKKEVLVDVGLSQTVPSSVWNYRVGPGTKNLRWEPAMTIEEANRAIDAGTRVADRLDDLDLVGIGEIGVGNTVASAAVMAAMLKLPPGELAGRGSGVNDKVLAQRIDIIKKALVRHRPRSGDALDVLTKVGCFELAAIAGFIIRADERHLPVVLDGYVTAVAALLATGLTGRTLDGIIASHLSREQGHALVLRELGLEPIFDMDLNYGEGLGAAIGLFFSELAFSFWRKTADN